MRHELSQKGLQLIAQHRAADSDFNTACRLILPENGHAFHSLDQISCSAEGALPNTQIRPGRRSVSQRFSPHPSSPLNLGCTVFSRVASAKSSLQFRLVYFRQPELESIEENLLVVGRLGEAPFANLDAATSWQDDVDHS
jgi:hypothetical protein